MDSLFKWHWALALFLLTFCFSGLVFPWVAEQIDARAGQDVTALDITPGFSPDEAYQVLESMGEEGRAFYQIVELTLDVVYPLAYGLFTVALLGLLLQRLFPGLAAWRRLAALGFLGALFDLLENCGIAIYISIFPGRADGLATLISVSGVLKFALIGLSFAVAAALLIFWGFRLIRIRR